MADRRSGATGPCPSICAGAGQLRISAAIRDGAAKTAGSVSRCLRERFIEPNREPPPTTLGTYVIKALAGRMTTALT
jgi:hypothetical protein